MFRTQCAAKFSSPSALDNLQPSPAEALQELVRLGFVKGHRGKCPSCKGKLSEPEEYQYEGHLYVRCCDWRRQQRFNVTYFSIFHGSRMKLPDLLKLLVFYARSNRLKSPKVSDAMSVLCSKKKHMFGHLEGDAHTIRKVYVSKTNPEFQDEVQDALRRWKAQKPGKPEPKYWLGHVRIVGIKARAAATVVVVLPTRLVPPGPSPPVESFVELKNSGLAGHINTDRGRQSLLHSDGAQAWPCLVSALGKPSVTSDHVSHSKHEFARTVAVKRRANKRPAAYITGTQSIDRYWQTAQDFIPATLHAKHAKEVNPDLYRYLFAFVWRYQLPLAQDFIQALADMC